MSRTDLRGAILELFDYFQGRAKMLVPALQWRWQAKYANQLDSPRRRVGQPRKRSLQQAWLNNALSLSVQQLATNQ